MTAWGLQRRHSKARLHQGIGCDGHLDDAVLSIAAARRRYDIADYRGINPSYGTSRDFKTFVREAHDRGLRVITELVINHTSDQHPWFKKARAAKKGSAARDFYVWSDTEDLYKETRIIFLDTKNPTGHGRGSAGLLLASFLQPSARSELRQSSGARGGARRDAFIGSISASTGCASTPSRTSSSVMGRIAKNLPETHTVIKQVRAALDASYTDACCSPRPINGPRRRRNISAKATNATWHSIFVDARIYMALRRRTDTPSPTSCDRPRNSGKHAMGDLPAQP